VKKVQKREAKKEVVVDKDGSLKKDDKPHGPIAAKVKSQIVIDANPELKRKEESALMKKAARHLEKNLTTEAK